VAGEPRSAETWLLARYRMRVGFVLFYATLGLLCLVLAFIQDRPGLYVGAAIMGGFLAINLRWLGGLKEDLARTRAAHPE
jgi:hypothetical protein